MVVPDTQVCAPIALPRLPNSCQQFPERLPLLFADVPARNPISCILERADRKIVRGEIYVHDGGPVDIGLAHAGPSDREAGTKGTQDQ